MSVYSAATTRLSSILKNYTGSEREKTKNDLINKVRFKMPKEKGISSAVNAALEQNEFHQLNEFMIFLKENNLSDHEFVNLINESRIIIHKLSPKFTHLVELILTLLWTKRDAKIVQLYTEFCVDLLVAQNCHANLMISKLIALWIPKDSEILQWNKGLPSREIKEELQIVHKLLDLLVTIIPMTYDVVLDKIEKMFPYFKKPSHVISGYVYNILWLLDYKPIFMQYLIQLLFQKLVILDVNAPRNEIEDAEMDHNEMIDDQQIFKMEEIDDKEGEEKSLSMKHPIAETFNICMELIYNFFDNKLLIDTPQQIETEKRDPMKIEESNKNFKFIINAFENVILPTHNTHHVQFLMFYICNSKKSFADNFLNMLWGKIKNPNNSNVIRQAATGYMASFLARSKILSLKTMKTYLQELTNWANQYILRSDECRKDASLKANIIFYSICEAVFYVIAFRSRNLTARKEDLLFLQSLHLSALVNCNLNPLRVCLPAVATAFAGVTRTYQLAYCHSILERNARRRLATVYMNDTSTPDDLLDTFFPFDPYLLKLSEKRISQFYLQYQASEAEETTILQNGGALGKHDSSEMMEDVDDFIIADKRQKLSKSNERDTDFTFSLSPGYQI